MAERSGRDGAAAPTRWTADTEVAFLLALRQTGSVRQACATIGRSTHGASDRRRRLPEFAARWQSVLDERQRERIAAAAKTGDGADAGLMPNRVRYDGWTPLRQRAFLRALSETGRYEDACRAVRVSSTAARAMRRLYPTFAAACDRAIAQAAGTLEQVAYERAVEGWDEPIVHAGKIVGHRRRYSEPLLRLLLQREAARDAGPAARAGGKTPSPRGLIRKPALSEDEVNAALTRKLDALARRDAARQRERMLAWADEMVRRGLAP